MSEIKTRSEHIKLALDYTTATKMESVEKARYLMGFEHGLDESKQEVYEWKTLSESYKSELTAAQAEIARLKEDRDRWQKHFEVKDDLCKYVVIELHKAESALDVAVEALSSMHIDTPMGWNLDNPENVTYEIAIGWHKSNNEKIEAALDKIKQIRGE